MEKAADDQLIDGKYAISDVLDLKKLQLIFEKFTQATGFTIGFLDHPNLNVLSATGWRDICTQFHRGCALSAEYCTKSNRHLLDQLNVPGQVVIEECGNGMVDCAMPIIIKGKHIASLATGQLFLHPPDLERFKRQAASYGYDEKKYLEAVKEVPVISEERLRNMTGLLGDIASLISELGYNNLLMKEEAERLENEITQRKKAEIALRESEMLYRGLIEMTNTGYVVTDKEGTVTDANLEYVRLTGHRELSEIRNRNVLEWTAPHEKQKSTDALAKCLKEGCLRGFEIDYIAPHGSICPIELNSTVVEKGGRILIFGICREITVRKEIEKVLRQSEERFRLIVESMNDAVFVHDQNNGAILDVNSKCEEMFGYSKEEFKHLSIGDLSSGLPPYTQETALKWLKKATKEGSQLFEWHARTKDGRPFWVEINMRLAVFNNCERIVVSVRDITDRKQLHS